MEQLNPLEIIEKKYKSLIDLVSSLEITDSSLDSKNSALSLIEELAVENCENLKRTFFYKATMNALPNSIYVKDGDAKYVFFNYKYEEYFGVSNEKDLGKDVIELKHLPEVDRKWYQNQDKDIIANSSVTHYEQNFILDDNQLHHALYWSKGFIVPETGERGLVGELVDISDKKELEKKFAENLELLKDAKSASRTDYATGIGNRYALEYDWDSLLAEATKENSPISLLIADLDSFKSINDTYGHSVGDDVIKAFSKVFAKTCRKNDICVRYGGEEFLAVFSDIDIEIAKRIAQRICESFKKAEILPDGRVATVSIGVTEYIPGEELNDTINRADKALYMMKNSGKDGFKAI